MTLGCTEICHVMKFGYFTPYKKHQSILQKIVGRKLVPGPFIFIKNYTKLYWKLKSLKHADYIKYIIAKISKNIKISKYTSSDSTIFLKNRKVSYKKDNQKLRYCENQETLNWFN